MRPRSRVRRRFETYVKISLFDDGPHFLDHFWAGHGFRPHNVREFRTEFNRFDYSAWLGSRRPALPFLTRGLAFPLGGRLPVFIGILSVRAVVSPFATSTAFTPATALLLARGFFARTVLLIASFILRWISIQMEKATHDPTIYSLKQCPLTLLSELSSSNSSNSLPESCCRFLGAGFFSPSLSSLSSSYINDTNKISAVDFTPHILVPTTGAGLATGFLLRAAGAFFGGVASSDSTSETSDSCRHRQRDELTK